jgi:osmotically-inducible protein OsmY
MEASMLFRLPSIACVLLLIGFFAGCSKPASVASRPGSGSAGGPESPTSIDLDAAIKGNLEHVISQQPWNKAHRIKVDVNQGVVTLTGYADTQQHASQLTDLAQGMTGVKHVINAVKVQGRTATANE